jgi:hypothetical protein
MVRISARPLTILTFFILIHTVVFNVSQTHKQTNKICHSTQYFNVLPQSATCFARTIVRHFFVQQLQIVGTFENAVILLVRFH